HPFLVGANEHGQGLAGAAEVAAAERAGKRFIHRSSSRVVTSSKLGAPPCAVVGVVLSPAPLARVVPESASWSWPPPVSLPEADHSRRPVLSTSAARKRTEVVGLPDWFHSTCVCSN